MIQTIPTNHTAQRFENVIAFRPSGARAGAPVEPHKWESLAKAVLRQAIDDAAAGQIVDSKGLRAWAAVAGIPWVSVECAIESAYATAPTAA